MRPQGICSMFPIFLVLLSWMEGCTLQDLLGRPLGFLILIFLETRLSGLSSYPKVGFHSVVIRGDCQQKIDFPLAGGSSM